MYPGLNSRKIGWCDLVIDLLVSYSGLECGGCGNFPSYRELLGIFCSEGTHLERWELSTLLLNLGSYSEHVAPSQMIIVQCG